MSVDAKQRQRLERVGRTVRKSEPFAAHTNTICAVDTSTSTSSQDQTQKNSLHNSLHLSLLRLGFCRQRESLDPTEGAKLHGTECVYSHNRSCQRTRKTSIRLVQMTAIGKCTMKFKVRKTIGFRLHLFFGGGHRCMTRPVAVLNTHFHTYLSISNFFFLGSFSGNGHSSPPHSRW